MSKTTENDMNVSPAFLAAAKLRAVKGSDYGGINEYFPFGHMSYVQMIHIKTKRLVNLTQNALSPQNESITDNILDLLNYASYYYEWMRGDLDE